MLNFVRQLALVSLLVLVVAGASSHATAWAQASAAPPLGQGELRSISLEPERVTFRGVDQLRQLLVTGHYANGGVRDLTCTASYRVANPQVARVEAGGLLVSVGNGTTEVVAEVGGQVARVQVVVSEAERETPIHFVHDIVPIFSKLGCNGGACHGKSSGQNGFRLSLLGFEPQVDYEALTREARSRRIFLAAPQASLLLRKPTGDLPHGGGKRLEPGSREYQLLLRWIRSGMPFGQSSDPKVVGIQVMPGHRLVAPKTRQQITVLAQMSDGSERDVTREAEYSSNDAELLSVSETGLVESLDRPGEGTVMVRYLGHVAVFRATIPQEVPAEKLRMPPTANFIDEHVFAKLRQLGLPPSDLCSDSEFLRRVFIDITGTLPTLAEVEKFLADQDPRKREKLVDDLLNRPEYANYFALKWGDILRNRQRGLVGVGGGAARTQALHRWIRDSLAANKPYDQFVREILTAQGTFDGENAQPPVAWYNVLRTPQALVDDMAQVFLGTRIQCAQCHHHPYEKWSQDDYWGLAAFFARVQLGNTAPRGGKPPPGGQRGLAVVITPEGRVTSPQGKVYTMPRPLGGEPLNVPAGQDPRVLLADWMTHPDNPFFARALVNRYWAHFFGRGIVEMPDDMRVSNPPSNPELLDALARDFVAHKYDLKHLIRTICTSRTYQLSSIPNEYNVRDKQNFARFYLRRLPAEVLVDAIDQVLGMPTAYGNANNPVARRAIELPDEAIKTALLAAFGKPDRASACECERSSAVTLTQSLLLIGSLDLHNKLKNPKSRTAQWAADPRPLPQKIREIYLTVYARPPTADELKLVEEYLSKQLAAAEQLPRPQVALAKQSAYEDLLWALLNTKEFLFNH
ncbi:MAG: DUF1549 and DUF1553 domain-containing protein [Gemmatales bacterium]|nr:DUF1549 and DUF1553 domain-containing protein [Gemmatales bacterium]MDW8176894.1 DUF1549 and DUF1553 domain-containing protein [Gemmatales bacterium]